MSDPRVGWSTQGRALRITVTDGPSEASWTIRPSHTLEQKRRAFAAVAAALGAEEYLQEAPGATLRAELGSREHPYRVGQDGPSTALSEPSLSADRVAVVSRPSHLPGNYEQLQQIAARFRVSNGGPFADEEAAERAMQRIPTIEPHSDEANALGSAPNLFPTPVPDSRTGDVRQFSGAEDFRQRPSVFDPNWRQKDTAGPVMDS